MMRSAKLWRAVIVVLVAHLILAVAAWYQLPPRIPTHFGAGGKADDWSSLSVFSWFTLLAVSAGLSVMIYFLTSPASEGVWNIGEKKRFLKLTPEQQKPVLDLVRLFGAASALCVNFTMLTLHLGIFLTASGRTKGLPWWMNIILFGAPLCLVAGIIPWDRAVQREVRRASGEAK